MKNRRSIISRLFSTVSPNTRRKVTYAAVTIIFVYGAVTAMLLAQVYHLVGNVAADFEGVGGGAILSVLYKVNFLIPIIFVGIGLFVLCAELGRNRQLASEMVPILFQIKCLQDGSYDKKRPMRKHDELQPIMTELHRLADQLHLGTSNLQSEEKDRAEFPLEFLGPEEVQNPAGLKG